MRGMAEDQELSPQPVVAPKRQFSLAPLFVIPVLLLPAILSAREVYNVVTKHGRSWGIDTIVFGLIYRLFFDLLSYFRRTAGIRFGWGGPLLWCGVRGSLYGLLHFSLLFLP